MDKSKMADFFHLQAIVRDFFRERDFWDVPVPSLVENPGLEPHLHPFSVHSAKNPSHPKGYLHTSPEFYMKELLVAGFDRIFALTYCFRDEPTSPIHHHQFLMLEWYRSQAHCAQMALDCQELITCSAQGLSRQGCKINTRYQGFKLERKSVDELFREILQISILDYLDSVELKKLIESDYPEVPMPCSAGEELDWEDLYFLLFLNKIEPALRDYPALLLDEFPHHLSALSQIKEEDPRVCQRFEIYLGGLELCNCFGELTDLKELKERVGRWEKKKEHLYGYRLPAPKRFYQSMKRGLPPSAGVALGMERLYMALTGNEAPFRH